MFSDFIICPSYHMITASNSNLHRNLGQNEIEYLIPSYNILVLLLLSNLMKKYSLLNGF